MAIVYDCEHPHKCIYRQKSVEVETDHKSQEDVLQKMIKKLHKCLLKVKYTSDEKLLTADVFPGLPVSSEGKEQQ